MLVQQVRLPAVPGCHCEDLCHSFFPYWHAVLRRAGLWSCVWLLARDYLNVQGPNAVLWCPLLSSLAPDVVVSIPGLQNDHKAVMKQVEEALHQLHAHDKEKQARDMAEAQQEAMSHKLGHPESHSPPEAFARVNSVSPGSPASIAVILDSGVLWVRELGFLERPAPAVHELGRRESFS